MSGTVKAVHTGSKTEIARRWGRAEGMEWGQCVEFQFQNIKT